ncbi:MAG TPA: NAD-dependent epimerase/dehydratase family protein [Ignavibacteriaceae bacterium]|nr:NAD-dependent epimerase/dehydratase family protein [Ignavibacteriaceae bacterium]
MGSTGRLGRDICLRLEELNATVIPIILKGYPEMPKRVEWASSVKPMKIYTKEDLTKLKPFDYVINFHWQVDRSKTFTEQLLYEINSNLSMHEFFWNWLKEKQPKNFINISTIKIFSELNEHPVSTSTVPLPLTPYGISKIAAENYFRALFNKTSTQVVNLRLGSIAAFGEVPTQLLTQLFNSAFNNKKIIVNKGHISNILYIDEAIDLIINSALIGVQGNYLLVGDGYLNQDISKRFEELSHRKLNAEYQDFNPGVTDPGFLSDKDKLRSSWTRSYSLDSMIEMIIELNLKRNSTVDTNS